MAVKSDIVLVAAIVTIGLIGIAASLSIAFDEAKSGQWNGATRGLGTVEHDGHRLIVLNANGTAIMHHPDCHCLTRPEAEAEVER